jgi:hypothetical protein
MIRIYPKPGLIVRDPQTRQPLPAEGIEVSEDNTYWLRREREGDISREPFEREDKEHGAISRAEEERNQRGEHERLADEEPAR